MTIDPFTTAAREYAEEWNAWADEQFSRGNESAQGVDEDSLVAGAEWARDHLPAQEPTDAEVLAALNAHNPAVSTPNLGHHAPSHVRAMRAALSAARAARRDEDPSGPLRPLTTDERSYRYAQELGYELPEEPR